MKTLINSTIIGLACILFAGCQTPQEQAMSQMERQMHAQVGMMEKMQKDMAEMEKAMEAMDKQMNQVNK